MKRLVFVTTLSCVVPAGRLAVASQGGGGGATSTRTYLRRRAVNVRGINLANTFSGTVNAASAQGLQGKLMNFAAFAGTWLVRTIERGW